MDNHRIIRPGLAFGVPILAGEALTPSALPYNTVVWSGESPPDEADWDLVLQGVDSEPIIPGQSLVMGNRLVEQEARPIKLLGRLTLPFNAGRWKDVTTVTVEAPLEESSLPSY